MSTVAHKQTAPKNRLFRILSSLRFLPFQLFFPFARLCF
jgi:hypothetical protein